MQDILKEKKQVFNKNSLNGLKSDIISSTSNKHPRPQGAFSFR